MFRLRIVAIVFVASWPAACNVGPDFVPPASGLPTAGFQSPVLATSSKEALPSATAAKPPDPLWWKTFRDPILTGLEQRVAEANLDVRTATVKIAESRAQRGVTAAAEFPRVDGTGKYQRELYSQNGIASLLPQLLSGATGGPPKPVPPIQPIDEYTTGFDASWELDLWGRVRRQIEAATAEIQASEDQRRGILVSTLAEVASDYIQLRGAQALIDIANENVKTERGLLELTQALQEKGLTTGLDVENAAAQVESVRAQIPGFEQQAAQQINALSLLLDLPPNGLRRELARAQASSLQYMAGPTITLPIFEGGRLTSMLELSKANQQEAAIAYRKAVLQAWHDVANALVSYRTDQQRRSRYESEVGHAQTALGLARARYNDGVADFTTVLTSAQTVLQAQQQFLQATVSVSNDVVQLYKALGGGWETTFPARPDDANVAEILPAP